MFLATHIRSMYIRNMENQSLTTREHKDLHDYYDYYKAYKKDYDGTGYIEEMFDKMKTWTIIDGK